MKPTVPLAVMVLVSRKALKATAASARVCSTNSRACGFRSLNVMLMVLCLYRVESVCRIRHSGPTAWFCPRPSIFPGLEGPARMEDAGRFSTALLASFGAQLPGRFKGAGVYPVLEIEVLLDEAVQPEKFLLLGEQRQTLLGQIRVQ